jgi:glycine cleavage system H protein
MNVLAGLRFTQSHEWVRVDGDLAVIGISDHAQGELGDVALLQMPVVGRVVQVGDALGEIESIKAVSDFYSPVAGEIVAVNEALHEAPETVNNDPYGSGWLVKVRMTSSSDLDPLLDADAYNSYVEEL